MGNSTRDVKKMTLPTNPVNFAFWIISIVFLTVGMGLSWQYVEEWRGGLDFGDATGTYPDNDSVEAQEPFFNLHICLMMFGFMLPNALAAGAFRFFTFVSREWAKRLHAILNTIGLVSALSGFAIVYRHEWAAYQIHFYSPHTWIGGMCLLIYAFQWVMGVLMYLTPIFSNTAKANFMPIHRALGQLSFILISLSVLLGLLTNYMSAFKYDSDLEANKPEKIKSINNSTIILTIGSVGVLGYILNTQFTRPKIQEKKVEYAEEMNFEANL